MADYEFLKVMSYTVLVLDSSIHVVDIDPNLCDGFYLPMLHGTW